MFIQTQATPNPQTMKFVPGVQVLTSGSISFVANDNASHVPIVQDLFRVEGVVGVFLAEDFITITKTPDKQWEILKPLVLPVMFKHLAAGNPIVIIQPDKSSTTAHTIEDEMITQIKAIIEEQVRPAVAQDGGDILFHDFVDGVVYLELHGSCAGCPSSTVTLKQGVENMLRHYIPEIKGVEAV